ncbi:MAG: hypothetical protein KAI24_19735, partial [Planctomycetes bacterium]|nr:hypothetical protein [Planctomycetota bacterium]
FAAALAALAPLALALPALAQRMPVEKTRQELQLFDLREIIGPARTGPDLRLQAEPPTFERAELERAAQMLRRFADPPLRPADDLRAIGDHWIAVLADAERIAGIERILTAAKKHREDLLTIEVQLLDVPAGDFRKFLQEHQTEVARADGPSSFQSVFGEEAAKVFLATCKKIGAPPLAAPRISVLPMQAADIAVVNQTAYVKDFTVTRTDDDEVIVDPIVDVVWSGHRAEVCATFLPGRHIGLACDVQFQDLQLPIPAVEVDLVPGAKPVTIQIPRTSGVRLSNVAEVAPGSVVALAARRLDGNFLVALIKANATGNR